LTSSVDGYLNQTARYQAILEFYNGAPAATLPLNDIEVGEDFKVRGEISALPSGGDRHAYLVGSLDGSPVTETLTFYDGEYGPELKITSTELFDTLTEVTTDMGDDAGITISIRPVDSDGDEYPPFWQEFDCRWEDKQSSYLKVSDDETGQLIAVSDAKVICTEKIGYGKVVQQIIDGLPDIGYEVVKVKPAVDLNGDEDFRILLLGGIEF
jgi:hypothetical protein